VLFREGEPGESLFIILEGQLQVLMGLDTPDERQLAVFGTGEFIGEMSLLIQGAPALPSVRADRPAGSG